MVKKIAFETTRYDDLTEIQRELLEAADRVKENAYNPYSRFYVGAAILTESGEIITGANVENVAYGSTICAERMAIGRANAMGHRNYRSIAIIARGEGGTTGNVTGPCGSCRQMLLEFSKVSGRDIEVIMSDAKKERIIISTILELLPLAFGPEGLGVDIEDYRK